MFGFFLALVKNVCDDKILEHFLAGGGLGKRFFFDSFHRELTICWLLALTRLHVSC